MTKFPAGMPHMSLGEVIDKVSILTRKIRFGEDDAIKEFEYLTEAVSTLDLALTGAMLSAIIRLTQMNFEIWELENELRKGGDIGFTAKEIRRRALDIRDINKKRVKYKNEINRLSEMGFREFKVNHRSQ